MLGRFSDAFGRKKRLLVSFVGAALSFAMYAVPDTPSLAVVFISHAIHGATQCTFALVYSSVTDLHEKYNGGGKDGDSLTHSFGLVGVAIGLGFILGPFIGGLLSAKIGEANTFGLSAIIFILCAVLTCTSLDETLPKEKRRPITKKTAMEAAPWRAWGLLFSIPSGKMITLAYFLGSFGIGIYSIWVLYLELRYGWSVFDTGVFMSLNGLVLVIAQGVLLRGLVPKYVSEAKATLVGLAAQGCMYFAVGSSHKASSMVFFTVTFGLVGALADPAVKSMISSSVAASKQGALQGALSSIYTIASTLSPLLYSFILAHLPTPTGETDGRCNVLNRRSCIQRLQTLPQMDRPTIQKSAVGSWAPLFSGNPFLCCGIYRSPRIFPQRPSECGLYVCLGKDVGKKDDDVEEGDDSDGDDDDETTPLRVRRPLECSRSCRIQV